MAADTILPELDPSGVDRLSKSAQSFGRSISDALGKASLEGRKLEDVIKSVGLKLSDMGQKNALKPLETSLSSLVQSFAGLLPAAASGLGKSLAGGLAGLLGFGGGQGRLTPFAEGGVINAPTTFPLARGVGLAGEAGPEAIMPLGRGPDGKLGVRASGGPQARPVSITVHVATPDAESFRRSEARVGAAIARAVARGQRAL